MHSLCTCNTDRSFLHGTHLMRLCTTPGSLIFLPDPVKVMLLHTNMFLLSQEQHCHVLIILDHTERHSVRSQMRSGFNAFSTVMLVHLRYTMLFPKLKSVV